jgi:autotransporter-associated beta strand protein
MKRSAKSKRHGQEFSGLGKADIVRRRRALLAVAVGAGASLLINPAARASYLYWNTATSGTWDNSTVANWTTSGASQIVSHPAATPGSNDFAIFNVPGTNSSAAEIISLSGAQSALGLIYANTGSTTIQAASGGPLTLTVGSGGISTSGIGGTNGPPAADFIGSTTTANSVNIALNGSQAWTNYSSNLLTIYNGVSDASSSSAATLTINNYVSTGTLSGTTFDGVISNNGSGVLALTVDSGTAGAVTLAAANTYTGDTSLQGGSLTLDFSQTTSPLTNVISASSPLILGGPIPFTVAGVADEPLLTLKGGGSKVNSQTFASTSLASGLSTIALTQNGATSLTLGLGTITRNANSALNFSTIPSASGVIATTNNTNEANGSGILGTWATVGTTTTLQYAAVSGGDIVAYSGATTDNSGSLASMTSAVTNYATSVANTLSAPAIGNTLRYTGSSSTTTALAGNTLTLNGFQEAGSGSLVISGGTLVIGADQEFVVTGTSAATLSLNASIANNGAGTSGVTYASLGVTILGGTNTYTGTTTLDSGYVQTNVGDVAGVSGALGVGGNITFNGGTIRYSAASAAGSDYSSRFKNSTSAIAIDLNFPGRNGVTWNGNIDSSNTGGMVIKSTNSTPNSLTLNGTNSYSGNTIIDNPIDVILGNSSALGTSTVIGQGNFTLAASTDLTGANALSNNIYNGSVLAFQGLHSIQLNGILGDYESVANNKAFVNNIGIGTLTLAGRFDESANPSSTNNLYYTGIGNTNITGVLANDPSNTGAVNNFLDYTTGTVTLSGSNTFNGSTIVYAGTLKLDFSAAGAPLTNIIPASVTGYKLTLFDGTLDLVGAPGLNNSETAAQGITAASGSSQVIFNPGAGGQLVFNAGSITASAGSYQNIVLSGASTATNGYTTSTTPDTYGLIKHLTVGSNDWATTSGTNVVAFSAYTDQAAVASWAANQNITNTTTGAFTGTLPSALTINSLRFNNNVAGGPDLGTNALTVSDGILVTSNVSGKSLTINDGSLVASGATDLPIINNGTNGTTLNIGATIQDTTYGTTATSITKAGSGVVNLSGNNTYTGTTYVSGGVLEASDSVTINGAGAGSITTGNQNFIDLTTAIPGLQTGEAVFGAGIPLGDTISGVSGNLVGLNVNSTAVEGNGIYSFGTVSTGGLGQGMILMNGGVLGLTSNFTRAFGTTYGTLELTASTGGFADLGTGSVTVNFGGNSTPSQFLFGTGLTGVGQDWGTQGYGISMILGSAYDTNTVNILNPLDFGSVSRNFEVDHGAAAIDAELSGVLSGASNISGFTKTGNGVLWLNATETYAGDTFIFAGEVTENGTGLISSNSPVYVAGSTAIFDLGANHSNTVNTVTLDGGGEITGTGTSALTAPFFDFRNGTVTAGLAGTGSLSKSTNATVTLSGSNTYTGGTTLAGGTLALASAGAIGTTGTVSFTGGTLQYSSSNQTDYSARFKSTGSQSFNIDTNGQTIVFATPLAGTASSLSLSDSAGGTGSLTIPTTSTYTGATTVNGGTLNVTGDLPNSATITVNGATVPAALILNSADAISAAAPVTVTGASASLLVNNAQAIASISSSGNATLTAGTSIVGLGNGVGTGTTTTGFTTGGITGTGTLTVNGTANLYASTITQKQLNVGSASTVTIADSAAPGNTAATSVLTDIANSGTLDLNNNDLIVLDTTQYSTVKGLIVNAYDGGAWDQPGITSSSARANASVYALGYAQASTIGSTSFDGRTFTDAVLVKYTLLGDSQLRGTVGLGDYDTVLSNYGTAQDWSGGDFHYGGVVGIGDYDDVLTNFGAHASGNVTVGPSLTRSISAAASINPDLAKTDLKLEVNTTTGDVYVVATASAAFTGYTISDPTAHLLGGSTSPDPDKLLSVAAGNGGNTNVYETSGTYVDWFKITETASQVAEGQQQNGFGTHSSRDDTINIPAGGTIDFGDIYNTAAAQQDLTFDFAEAGTEPTNGPTYYGAEVDYISSSAPEPASVSLLAIGAMGMLSRRRRRIGSVPPTSPRESKN